MFEEGSRKNDPELAREILDKTSDLSPLVRKEAFDDLRLLAWKDEYLGLCRTILERGKEDPDPEVRKTAKELLSCMDEEG